MRVNGMLLAACAVLLLAGAGAGRREPKDVTGDDAVPPGMVSFFTTSSCPGGWMPETLSAGRIVVAVTDPIAVGRTVGTALGDGEDRAHGHTITASIDLPAKSISAADGNNGIGGSSGTRTLGGAAGPAPSGLPFVQLVACVRGLNP